MNNERPHSQDSTRGYQAIDCWYVSRKLMNLVIAQNAQRMGSRQNTQRTILRCRVVEMNAQSQNLAQGSCRSVRVNYIFFYRPRTPAGRFFAFTKRYSRILMPYHQPIGVA